MSHTFENEVVDLNTDIEKFVAMGGRQKELEEEMLQVFLQKRRLGLVNCPEYIIDNNDKRPTNY